MNASKSLALAFVVGFLLAAPATSCGPTSTGCDADSCAHGCCDAAGKCQTANSVFQCGQGGDTCKICGATQQCIIGICTGGSGAGPGGGAGSTGGGSGSTGGGSGSTGGGSGSTGGGFSSTGGGFGSTGGGFGSTGGGFGSTGGGVGSTGGGVGSTGGGVGSTGGGVGSTGGGVGSTGGGTGTCPATAALNFVSGTAAVNGDTTNQGNDVTFSCYLSESYGTDLIYSFTTTGTATSITASVSFNSGIYGGLGLVALGQCTTRSATAPDCYEPANDTGTLVTTLPAGSWGLVVKTYGDGSTSYPGGFSLNVTREGGGTGGGTGSTGGGSGSTGGGSGGGPTCGECTSGAAKSASCSACTTAVCAGDSYCCTTAWDSSCVAEVGSYCSFSCP